MKINLPNKLTILRVFMVPLFIFLFMLSSNKIYPMTISTLTYEFGFQIDIFRLLSALVFAIASTTDFLDGYIARKYKLITNFGKLLDPLADKILVLSSLMLLSANGEINIVWIIIVAVREISISAIRLVCLEQGVVVAASIFGKYKTATQMIFIILMLFNMHTTSSATFLFTYILFVISELLVIVSFVDYVYKNKDSILIGGM